jgi:hypothetical protein
VNTKPRDISFHWHVVAAVTIEMLHVLSMHLQAATLSWQQYYCDWVRPDADITKRRCFCWIDIR